MQSSNDNNTRTIRELGGEIWSELLQLPESILNWRMQDHISDLVMGVLARHAGKVIVNDQDLPVEPLPKRHFEES